ncbi:MAG TPA: peptide deformylase [Pyrinomonadaceae bacterium]|nr:peptide deformylase [Pyrinomonadaceae bacterium]
MTLEIVQTGDPVLRKVARMMTVDEIRSDATQELILQMRDTMRAAPGVGLAAPQIGESIQLAVIEDRIDYIGSASAEQLAAYQRSPVDFHVVINPTLTLIGDETVDFFEGCLSVEGFSAVVSRSLRVRVECLNERAEPITINAHGWYARILQHEIDHLNGTLYIDRMQTRSFSTMENAEHYWHGRSIDQVHQELGIE